MAAGCPCCGLFSQAAFLFSLKRLIPCLWGFFVGCFFLGQHVNFHMGNLMSHWQWEFISSTSATYTCACELSLADFFNKMHGNHQRVPLPISSSAALHRGPRRRHLQSCFSLGAVGWTTCQLAVVVVEGWLASSLAVSLGPLSPFITAMVRVKGSANS